MSFLHDGASCLKRLATIEQKRHGTIVDERDIHMCLEATRTNSEARMFDERHKGFVEFVGERWWRGI